MKNPMEDKKYTDELKVCKNCQSQLSKVSHIEKLSSGDLFILENPRKIFKVHFPIRMDDGSLKMIPALRVQYNDALGPTKGGIRFHEEVDEEDVTELAFLMSLKTSLLSLPYGGAKGGITINPKKLSEAELERVARGYVKEMHKELGPKLDIPAPDVNTNPQIMAWMMDEYEKLAGEKTPGSFTGKPLILGGSEGRNESTARGAFYIIEERFKDEDPGKIKVAIQGFGNAGSNLAKMLMEAGFKVVAVSDSKTGIYEENGFDIHMLMEHKKKRKSFEEYDAEKITNHKLLELDVDILVPAALGGVITEKNAKDIKAKLIVELANAPIQPEVDQVLHKKNIAIIPDILANAGGVVVSYFEWVQNMEHFYWEEDEVNEKLKKKILKAYSEVLEESEKHNVNYRTASYIIAIHRILEAEKLRGRL